MKAKKLLIGGLATMMLATAAIGFAACGENNDPKHDSHPDANNDGICDIGGEKLTPTPGPEPTEVTIHDGIYISDEIDMGAGRGNAYNYVRFHENGVFYYAQMAQAGGSAGGGMNTAGYYKVVEQEMSFTDYTTGSATNGQTLTASSYIEFTNFDGSEYGIRQTNGGTEGAAAEYDNKVPLYNDTLYAIWYSNMKYTHITDNTDFTVDKEVAKEVANYGLEEDNSLAVILKHNGTFEDTTELGSDDGDYYTGTWTYAQATKTYTLTSTGSTATLKIADDEKTAEYKRGTKTITLKNGNATDEEEIKAVVEVTANSFFKLSFYNDGTFKVWADMGGQTQDFESGKWSMAIPTLTLGGTDYTMTAEGISAIFTVTTSQGETPLTFALSRDQLMTLKDVKIIEPKPIVEATCQFFTLGFYKDGTYKVTASMGTTVQEMKSGTWSLAIPTLSIDETNYTMTAEGITVTINLTTSQGANDYEFALTRDQLMTLKG